MCTFKKNIPMALRYKLMLVIVLLGAVTSSFAQDSPEFPSRRVPVRELRSLNPTPPSDGVLTRLELGHAACVDSALEADMWKLVNENIDRLGIRKTDQALRGATPTSFIWPVQSKAGFNDYGYYTVQFLVDHNAAFNNQLLDYNCGARTYDGNGFNHAGTDIILWPYAWRRMDEQVMEIVAAAPGVIVSKFDNNYDRKCLNNGQGVANGFHIVHDDGSVAWYWHMKTGSLNSKSVGDSVVAGEYLGTAGSSGSSNWPHLHFQVWGPSGALIDPWDGSCNSMNQGTSWWQTQQPYLSPSVNRICTKNTIVEYYNCPTPEITNERDTFYLGDTLAIWLYIRDLVFNSTININLKNPSGQTPITFNWTSPWATWPTNYVMWYYNVDAWWTPGWWTFEAVYGGQTYQHSFFITGGYAGTTSLQPFAGLTIAPNPAQDHLRLSGIDFHPGQEVRITTPAGMEVRKHIIPLSSSFFEIETTDLAAGVYLLEISGAEGRAVRRLVISR